MDIDTSNFDAKRYVLSMLKQNSIKQLVRRNNEIEQQIKIHDHEIQSLVFQNYSKFISSIDTVRQMKDNICAVDDKLKILQKSMDKISDLALKIDSTFSVKRKQIQKLDTINKDLQKLKNLCQFPNILQQDIKFYKSIPEGKLSLQVDNLFSKSIASYQACYKTLISLKQQTLIAPIYKQSIDKVETMRSTLKALQAQFNKNKTHSSILRNITKKLLIITDDQISVLRIYIHSWKQRFSEGCFKSQRKPFTLQSTRRLNQIPVTIPQVNQQLWKQFELQFSFIYDEVYPRLNLTAEQIQLHVVNYIKDIFNWALNHYGQALPLYCNSLKSFVHVHHAISHPIFVALKKIQASKDANKLGKQLNDKMNDKFQQLGNNVLNYVFGRAKLYFLLQIAQTKNICRQFPVSQQSLKQGYIKSLNPLKQNVTTNFKTIIDDMQHFKNIYNIVFRSQQKYSQAVHKQIQNYLSFVAIVSSKTSLQASEEICSMTNPSYTVKLNKNQKNIIQNAVKQFSTAKQSCCWFVASHYFLTSLSNNFAKKIIQNAQKNVQIPKNYNYAELFNKIKIALNKNLINSADYSCLVLRQKNNFDQKLLVIQDFIDVLNIIFVDYRRAILKKPSFIKDTASIHETQVLAIKKLHLIQKKLPSDRNSTLLYFIRKLMKQLLFKIRQSYVRSISNQISAVDVYCLFQICYELINVEQQSHIAAFYKLVCEQKGVKPNIQQAEQRYNTARKLLRVSK